MAGFFANSWRVKLRAIQSLLHDDRGMETVEWAVLASLVVAGLIGVVWLLGLGILRKMVGLQVATSGQT